MTSSWCTRGLFSAIHYTVCISDLYSCISMLKTLHWFHPRGHVVRFNRNIAFIHVEIQAWYFQYVQVQSTMDERMIEPRPRGNSKPAYSYNIYILGEENKYHQLRETISQVINYRCYTTINVFIYLKFLAFRRKEGLKRTRKKTFSSYSNRLLQDYRPSWTTL